MIIDSRTEFSDKQAITATANSTNVIDLGAEGSTFDGVQLLKALGRGCNIPLNVQVTEDFDNLTSLAIILQESADEAFTVPIERDRQVVLLADLVTGFQSRIDKIPFKIQNRYIRFRYEVTGAAPTQGQISASVVAGHDRGYSR